MRAALVLSLLAFTAASALPAIDRESGKIIQGKYFASGNASTAGIKVQYLRSKARVTVHGRVKGFVTKIVTAGGQTLQNTVVRIRGNVKPVHRKRGSFTAPALLHLSDGVSVRGEFHGLVDKSQRLSRYFRGEINRDPHSNFVLRAR